MNPFKEPWFIAMSFEDKLRWLVEDAKHRPPLEWKTYPTPAAPIVQEIAAPAEPALDKPQDPKTDILINSQALPAILEALRNSVESEIVLPTLRSYRMGEGIKHSAVSIICLAHAKAAGIEAQEADIRMIDEVDRKYQFYYSNFHDALRWAFGSDHPTLPDSLGLPVTGLLDLLCMTKKSNKRAKVRFAELADILESLARK